MKKLYQWRFAVFGVLAVGLLTAMVLIMRSDDKRPAGGATAAPVGFLGPTDPDVDAYIEDKNDYLDRMSRSDPGSDASGLIAFKQLLTQSEVRALTKGMQAIAVYVDFPASTSPEGLLVTGSVKGVITTRADQLATIARTEADAFEQRGDEAEATRLKGEADLTTPDCACVYAVAVEDVSVKELSDLRKADEVRLVDVPDPLTDSLRGWELGPLHPSPEAKVGTVSDEQ